MNYKGLVERSNPITGPLFINFKIKHSMKHLLYKQGTYVEIDVGQSHLQVIGKVKDSTVVNKRIRWEDVFNIPQQAIELEMCILTIFEDPEITPKITSDPFFVEGMIKDMNGLVWQRGKLYASIEDISSPDDELKKLYRTLKQGAKRI